MRISEKKFQEFYEEYLTLLDEHNKENFKPYHKEAMRRAFRKGFSEGYYIGYESGNLNL